MSYRCVAFADSAFTAGSTAAAYQTACHTLAQRRQMLGPARVERPERTATSAFPLFIALLAREILSLICRFCIFVVATSLYAHAA
jgi:hypothetical protein